MFRLKNYGVKGMGWGLYHHHKYRLVRWLPAYTTIRPRQRWVIGIGIEFEHYFVNFSFLCFNIHFYRGELLR